MGIAIPSFYSNTINSLLLYHTGLYYCFVSESWEHKRVILSVNSLENNKINT